MVAPRIQIYVDESIHDSLGFIVSAFVFSKDRLDGRVAEALSLELDAPKRAMPPNKALQPGRQACCACQDCQPWST